MRLCHNEIKVKYVVLHTLYVQPIMINLNITATEKL